MSKKEKIRLLILQSTPFCNINCKYCYLSESERSNTSKMSMETLEYSLKFIEESGRLDSKITVLWHAGEPLAMPLSYYEQSIELIESRLGKSVKIAYNIQTNAVALNQEWCDFFKKYKFTVGVSIDGPEDVHDKMRVRRTGEGTFKDTVKGINLLRENSIEFSTISVVTESSLDRASELMEFLRDIGTVSVGFNFEEKEGFNEKSTLSGNDDKVKRFIEDVRLWLEENNSLSFNREFHDILSQLIIGPNGKVFRRGENKCFSIITVGHDGRVSTFSPELHGYPVSGTAQFTFGTVHEGFDKFERNRDLIRVSKEIEEGVNQCEKECSYFDFCGGGAPSNKWQETGSFTSSFTEHCKYHRRYFVDSIISHAKEQLTDCR